MTQLWYRGSLTKLSSAVAACFLWLIWILLIWLGSPLRTSINGMADKQLDCRQTDENFLKNHVAFSLQTIGVSLATSVFSSHGETTEYNPVISAFVPFFWLGEKYRSREIARWHGRLRLFSIHKNNTSPTVNHQFSKMTSFTVLLGVFFSRFSYVIHNVLLGIN